MTRPTRTRRLRWLLPVATALGLLLTAVLPVSARSASATSFVPVSGAGSTWSENALNQWITDVQQYGMRVNYAGTGSTDGRHQFIEGTVDFAASDIPFQTNPNDGSAPETPAAGSYAYMPITAGGTAFMYNLIVNGQRVTNLRLSGTNITKIFTGVITNWSDPALAADNPGITLPNRPIVPVVRSDGSGSTAQLTTWMINQYPSLWNSYCGKAGRAPACGVTSFFPTINEDIAQSGDLGVATYVAQNYADGAIGYVNYSYALNAHFPVVEMLNSAGYYTLPTPQNVAVSLLKAVVDTTDVNNPALYLTENLTGVYTDPDPRTYPLSSYSYLILPTKVQGQFTTAKGTTLAAFAYYSMCQGQQEAASLGYSPMPINLVQASFDQITKIPGAVVQNITLSQCNNPTFSTTGVNTLAQTAPQPQPCQKQGSVVCVTSSTGAIIGTLVAVTGPTTTVAGSAAGNTSTGTHTATGATSTGSGGSSTGTGTATGTATGTGTGVATGTGTGAVTGTTLPAASSACDPSTQNCAAVTGSQLNGQDASASAPIGTPTTLTDPHGWGLTQMLLLLGGLFIVLLVAPGLVIRYLRGQP